MYGTHLIPRKAVAITALMACCLIPANARAAFIGGVEQFNGISIDLSTWEAHYTSGTVLNWNNVLMFDNRTIPSVQAGGRGELVTLNPLVGVGQYVEAQVTVTGATTISPMASLRLSTKTHVDNSNLDSYTIDTALQPLLTGIQGAQAQNGSGSGSFIADPGTQPDMINKTYFLRIERIDSSLARLSAYDSTHTQIGTTVSQTLSGAPDNMHIVLNTQEVAAQFDNVTIGIIPEPSTVAVGSIIALYALQRRRKLRSE